MKKKRLSFMSGPPMLPPGYNPGYQIVQGKDYVMILIEAGPRILPPFPEDLAARAESALKSLGVEVLTNSPVTAVDSTSVTLAKRKIATPTAIWAAMRQP